MAGFEGSSACGWRCRGTISEHISSPDVFLRRSQICCTAPRLSRPFQSTPPQLRSMFVSAIPKHTAQLHRTLRLYRRLRDRVQWMGDGQRESNTVQYEQRKRRTNMDGYKQI